MVKKIKYFLIGISTIFIINSSYAQIEQNAPIIRKIEELQEEPQQAKFGFNVLWWQNLDQSKKQKVFSLLKQLQIDWVRVPFEWNFIEAKKGKFDFTRHDNLINEFSKNNINLLLITGWSPRWAVKNPVKANALPPDEPNDYANFLAKAAERYKDKSIAWEIWNEPDNPPFWGMKQSTPQEYINLLKPAYEAIKKVAPDAVVVGACVLIQFMEFKSEPDYSYLKGLLDLGLLKYCDVVSVHIYPKEDVEAINSFNQCVDTIEKMIHQYGKNEIWVTEVGMFSKRFSIQKLAQLLAQKGLTPLQIQTMSKIPACKLAFMPVKTKEIHLRKMKDRKEIEQALSEFGLSFEDALQLTEQSFIDAQKEQADFVEDVYVVSKKHRMFWFQFYDLFMSDGILDKDLNCKLAYQNLLSLLQDIKDTNLPQPSKDITLDNGPWPMYCHDPQHTCRSPYKGLTEQPMKPKWICPSPGGFAGFPSCIAIGNNGKIYAGTAQNEEFIQDNTSGYSGILCAIFPDGKIDWLHDSHRGGPMISMIESGPLLTSDGKIIYGKDDGHVYALNQEGRLLWDFSSDDPFNPENLDDNEQIIPSPVLGTDNTLYILSHWGNVYCHRTINAWEKNPRLRPIIEKYNIKPVRSQVWGKLYAVDVQTGERKWVFDPSSDEFNKQVFWGSPAVGKDGTIYAAAYDNSYNGYLYALNPDGTQKWKYPGKDHEKIQALQSSPSIGDEGTIYVGSFGARGARLYAFNPDGTLKWSYQITENRITSCPGIGPDGSIYFGSHNHPGCDKGFLYNLNDLGTKAELKWKFGVTHGIIASSAIDSQGNVFFKTSSIHPQVSDQKKLGDYHLYALNNKGEKLWSYPFKGNSWGFPSIGKDGTIYICILGNRQEDRAGLYAFGPNGK